MQENGTGADPGTTADSNGVGLPRVPMTHFPSTTIVMGEKHDIGADHTFVFNMDLIGKVKENILPNISFVPDEELGEGCAVAVTFAGIVDQESPFEVNVATNMSPITCQEWGDVVF